MCPLLGWGAPLSKYNAPGDVCWWCSRQRGGLHSLLNLAISPERMPLTHGCRRLPPDMPAPGIEPTTFRLRDLRLAHLS